MTIRIRSTRTLVWTLLSLAIVASLTLSACAKTKQGSGPSKSTATSQSSSSVTTGYNGLPSKLVNAAINEAKTVAGNKTIGGTLTVLGVNSGSEAKELVAAMKPFETATGVRIKYTGTEDQAKVLAAGVQAKNPPDIVDGQGAGLMIQFADSGNAVPLSGIIDSKMLSRDYSKGLIDGTTVNGKVYGLWGETDTFQVWYNTKTYHGPKSGSWSQLMSWARQEASKTPADAPFCMGLSAGAGSGFPAQSWIESVFLGKYGPQEFKKWTYGQLPWTSPQVKWAWEQFGAVAASNTLVSGGPQSAVSTSIVDYSKGMFSSPQACQLTLWGNFAAGLIKGIYPNVKIPRDLSFFPIPASSPAYANDLDTNGHVTFMMKSTTASRAFMKYWQTPAAQSLIAAGGSWTVGNKGVPLSAYPNAAMRRSAEMLQKAKDVVAGPSTVVTSAVQNAYLRGIIAYVQDPSKLDSILAKIQATQKQ